MDHMDRVVEIEIRMRLQSPNGAVRQRVATFIRREKIDDLLSDPGSLGGFFRDLRDAFNVSDGSGE